MQKRAFEIIKISITKMLKANKINSDKVKEYFQHLIDFLNGKNQEVQKKTIVFGDELFRNKRLLEKVEDFNLLKILFEFLVRPIKI